MTILPASDIILSEDEVTKSHKKILDILEKDQGHLDLGTFERLRDNTMNDLTKILDGDYDVFEELEKIGSANDELKTILSTKIEYLYKEYFNSQEFQNSIKELIDIGEYYDYIYLYIKKSKEFFDYYSIKKLKNENIYKSE